ncbi:chromate transporter [Meiothermus sp. QL-1]|uniref:chromate transporter n=1 Tax=Meiothermus sp. QL-1 TaxID=2058095 RepID=UPI001F2BF44C|nr:chromate transporter [Meiothermus sp. QL-1]
MKVSLPALFWAFLQVGLVAFGGGGSAQLYQALVRRRGWMKEREFLEATALCRILPGPVFANMAVHLGTRLGGVVGGVLALLGVLTPGALLMLFLSLAYLRLGALPGSLAESALSGVTAAAIGLILATLFHQAPLALGSLKAVGLALGVFVTYGLLHWPLLLVLLCFMPLGVMLYWPEAAEEDPWG